MAKFVVRRKTRKIRARIRLAQRVGHYADRKITKHDNETKEKAHDAHP